MFKYCFRILLFVLLAGGIINCEGRVTKSKALKKSIAEFSNKATITKLTFHPENYAEKEVDTLLENGFQVKLNTFTDMEADIPISIVEQDVVKEFRYRVIKSNLEVRFGEKLIYNDIVDKSFIAQQLNKNYQDWENYNLRDIWVDQDASLNKNLLSIRIEFRSVSSNACKSFNLQLNKNGMPYISELDQNNN